jgi:hypothetical protein
MIFKACGSTACSSAGTVLAATAAAGKAHRKASTTKRLLAMMISTPIHMRN